jgi:transcription factor TFIIIB component B''
MTSDVQQQGQVGLNVADNNNAPLTLRQESVNNTGINNSQASPETTKKTKQPQQKTVKGRPRKRKTTVLAIGSSRQASSETTTDANSTALVTITGENDSNGLLTAKENVVTDATQNDVNEQIQQSHLPLLSIPPIIPENNTGKPPLSAFCTSFPTPKKSRTRRKGAHHADATAPALAAAVPEQELPLPNSTQHAGPQVQIVNGEIVLQESSIVFQGSGATQAHEGNEAMTVVEEEAQLAVVGATYTSFATGRRARTNLQQWTVDETKLFYEALRQVGLDFGTMESYFENAEDPTIRKRSRRQLKHKYKAESNKNPSLVEKALRPSSRMDIGTSCDFAPSLLLSTSISLRNSLTYLQKIYRFSNLPKKLLMNCKMKKKN